MAGARLCLAQPDSTAGGASLRHALDVLAEATGATVVLFDSEGHVVIGPVAGNDFVREIIRTQAGRQMIVAAHRAAMEGPSTGNAGLASALGDGAFEYFAIPVMHEGYLEGMLTLGDRPRGPLSREMVSEIESATSLAPGQLGEPAGRLAPWDAAQAAGARNMAALVTELFADLCVQESNLRSRIEELSTVYNIAGLVAGTLDVQEVLDRIARMVCAVMKVKACSIRLLDETTGRLVIRAVNNLSDEYLNKGEVTLDENPIDAAAIQGEVVHIADAPNDPRTRYPEQARREGIVSGLVCGMIYRGKAVGVLRVYTGQPHEFSPFEDSLLRAVASQAAAAIVNARLVAETLEAERYARQIAYAGEVQRRMIPAAPPECKQAEIGAVYRPTFNVGGDFYDFITLPKGNLGVAIADVSGKGVPASLLMASLRAALRVYACFTYDIDRIMTEVNGHVCRETTVSEFATVFYGVLSPDGRRLTYCNAGHAPPLLLREGKVQELGTGGMLLGVDPAARFERELLSLRAGDLVLLYTDGAVDALDFSAEPFGLERLIASFVGHANLPAQLIAKNILWDIRRFRGLADRTDDLTLVVLRIR